MLNCRQEIFEVGIDYLAVIRRYRQSSIVIDKHGGTYYITNEALENSVHVSFIDGEEPRERTGKVLNYKQYLKAGKPKIYLGVISEGKKNTRILLTDYHELKVPNEDLKNWHNNGDYEYFDYIDQMKYPHGRKLKDMTFGVEFEFSGLLSETAKQAFIDDMKALVGERFAEKETDSEKWILGYDSSIKTKAGYYGYELRTPILHHTEADYQLLSKVLGLVKIHLKGEVNQSCGTHIHFGNFTRCSDYYYLIMEKDTYRTEYMDTFKKLSLCYGALEQAVFDRLVDRSRRKDNNEYCESCKKWKEKRHRKINLECYEDNGTLENRHHHGTLDVDNIWHWMEMVGLFVLKFFSDMHAFDQIKDVPSFFETIDLPESSRQYYNKQIESTRQSEIRQIETMMKNADFRETNERESDPADVICIRQIHINHACACA